MKVTAKQEKLVILQKEMSDLTAPECAKTCHIPHSCCDLLYCQITREYAKEEWGVELQDVPGGRLPFLGPEGCVVAPHLRPLCTVHTCEINSLGFKKNDFEWTKKYFELREKIESLL